jgi:hypothetical protein
VKPQTKYALGLTFVTAVLAALVTLLALSPALAQPAGVSARLGAEAAGWGLFSAGLATGL